MALFLDSASLDKAKTASRLGFICGVTTNPVLLAASDDEDIQVLLQELCSLFQETVFYQLRTTSPDEMVEEANQYAALAPNLGIKILATLNGFEVAAKLAHKITVAMTAVYTPSQAYLATGANVKYIIPYVNRLNRFTGSASGVIRELAAVLRDTDTQLLAAGIKTPLEAIQSLIAGASHLSLPLEVIESMAYSDLTQQAKNGFDEVNFPK